MMIAPSSASFAPPLRLRSRGWGSGPGFSFCTTLDRPAGHRFYVNLGGLHVVRAQRVQDEAAPPDDEPTSPQSPPPTPTPTPTPPPTPTPIPKQSLLEALDFSAIRSQDDVQLLEEARSATGMGQKMSREQYAALRRKIGGTYRDFFKDSIEVEGDFVDEGWVDKSCRFCKKDTASEPRTFDKFGRYAHISCLEKSKSGNFFTRLFGM